MTAAAYASYFGCRGAALGIANSPSAPVVHVRPTGQDDDANRATMAVHTSIAHSLSDCDALAVSIDAMPHDHATFPGIVATPMPTAISVADADINATGSNPNIDISCSCQLRACNHCGAQGNSDDRNSHALTPTSSRAYTYNDEALGYVPSTTMGNEGRLL
jgi:hypothetical protein